MNLIRSYFLFFLVWMPLFLCAQENAGVLIDSAYKIRRSNPKLSLTLANEAYTISIGTKNQNEISESLLRIASAYMYLNQYDSSLHIIQKGISFDKKRNIQKGLQTKYNTLGILYKRMGNHNLSIDAHQNSLKQSHILNDSFGQAKSYNNIGTTYKNLGYYDLAHEHLLNSLIIKELIGDQKGVIATRTNLANVFAISEQFSKAIDLHKKNLNHHLISQNDYEVAKCYLSLSETLFDSITTERSSVKVKVFQNTEIPLIERTARYSAIDQIDSVLIFANKARTYFVQNQIEYMLANTLIVLGSAHQVLERYDSALWLFNSSLEIYEQHNNRKGKAIALNNIGDTYKFKSQYATALKYFLQSFELAKAVDNHRLVTQLYGNLGYCYQALGGYEVAFDFLKTYEYNYYKNLNEVKSRQITEMQTKYETQKKEQEIEHQKAEIDLRIKQRDTYMISLAIVLTLTIGLVLIYQQRQKVVLQLRLKEKALFDKKVDDLLKSQELESIRSMLEGEEKERGRIAQDLHDRIGSMISALKLQLPDNSGQNLASLIDETAEELRRISHNLQTGVLNKFGLVAALEDLQKKILDSNKISFELVCHNLDERIDNTIEIAAYRIIQELVSNALKHSQATEITTQAIRSDDQLTLMVEDNGIGFHFNREEKSEGMGLRSVASRIKGLDGTFDIDSGRGQGTTVTVQVPI